MANWVPALRLTGIGFYIVLCILGGTFAGLWIDKRLDTAPWFLLGGLLAGLGLAAYGVFRMLRPLLRGDDNHTKENS
jgi:ATP synthase protein I